MDKTFTDLIDRARAAIIVKDSGGYCVHANPREEELRGVEAGGLLGRHITELVDADPRLVEREWDRFKQEGSWVGQFRTRAPSGELVRMRTYNFTHREWDGNCLYVSFAYLVDSVSKIVGDGPIVEAGSTFAPKDVCLAQLFADGFSDDDVCVLLGVSAEDLALLIGELIARTGSGSKTEACIRALKAGFIA